MIILAIDTATEQCSVALLKDARTWTRSALTARGHADLVLTMIEEVLSESATTMTQLNAIAFGRGPGSFTGVRIAVSVAQGLSFARQLPVIGISDLAAVAQQVANERAAKKDEHILVCMDARMQEVYWAIYKVPKSGNVLLTGEEHVSSPTDVIADASNIAVAAGTGWQAYALLRDRYPALPIAEITLPRALEIAQLAAEEFVLGSAMVSTAAAAQPVYLRDQVVASVKN